MAPNTRMQWLQNQEVQCLPIYQEHNDGYITPVGGSYYTALQYRAQPGQVFVCTYPKCGTTWTANILYLIEHDGEPLPPNQSLTEYMPFLERAGKEKIEKISPKYIKTHLPYEKIPYNLNSKYIFIARNPKDACVSKFYHTKGFKNLYHFENGKFDDYFELFINGQTDFGDYFDYINSWNNHINDENVLFIIYEDMKKDIQREIFRIAEFLGPKYVEKIHNNEILKKIIDHSKIENMKKVDCSQWVGVRYKNQNYSNFKNIQEKENILARPKSSPFVRKGQNGDWKNYFSEKQSKKMDQKFQESTKGTIFEHIWDNVM